MKLSWPVLWGSNNRGDRGARGMQHNAHHSVLMPSDYATIRLQMAGFSSVIRLAYEQDKSNRTYHRELDTLDDEDVLAVADIVQDMESPTASALTLTDAERAAIMLSKEDFKEGRTLDGVQYHAEMTAFLLGLKPKRG